MFTFVIVDVYLFKRLLYQPSMLKKLVIKSHFVNFSIY